MRIQEIFAADVTRDIPPVVYFHEQSPHKLAAEVSEYIITGGYPEGDPRARRVQSGIHEQLVHLLKALTRELDKKGGPELPASWISGFYGSGKSSFAKLLGLALDGVRLPDGRTLAEALLARDDSPKRAELAAAWAALHAKVEPIAVVFDIGAVARDDEHIHSAVLRQVQARLGYCKKSHLVAEHELKLERDGEYELFLATAQKVLGRPWPEAQRDEQADDHFSHVLHAMNPERYVEPMSWIDSRAGAQHGGGSSVKEVVEAIEAMLDQREPGKALFLVVDEVSQYVHQVDDRMLKLQTFVAALGQQLRGKVWLLATGQQKLDDAAETGTIVKLKDRFPPSLRVHLASTNIRDVVHKRLLKKTPHHDPLLRELFSRHRSELKLYAYDCHSITEEDFVEVYPMLPGQVDLLMQITTNLRAHSRRTQSDDHAIRGLLQLLGELFREQRLGERELGALVTLDAIYEVQASALDADVQTTLARLLAHPEVREDTLALRAAKAVALLELIQESTPTSAELVAQCLYARLGQGDETPQVRTALERMKALGLLSFSEKQGYKLQSSAGQEWQAERMTLSATGEERSALVRSKLKNLIALDQRPKLGARPFPLGAWYSDGKQASDVRLQDPRDDAAVTFDFRFLGTKDERSPALWVQESDREALRDRILWVAGDGAIVTKLAGELASSQRMIDRYLPRRDSLSTSKQRLLLDEQAHAEELEGALARAVSEAYLRGAVYFRGGVLGPTDHGTSFSTALQAIAVKYLPAIFPHFTDIAVTDGELSQLLAPTLSGPSTKFFEEGLGILSLDAGKYVPTCHGTEPTRILAYITEGAGASGAAVLQKFARPPYGYPADVVRACLAGLLRAGKVRIRPATGPDITSIRDPGTQDLFRKVSELRSADVFPPKEGGVVPRDRVAICAFFQKHLGLDVPRSDDDIADAVFQQFPAQRDKLRVVEGLLERVPGRPPLPPALAKLAKALEDCRRSRQVEETVLATRKHLDTLGDGLEQLGMYVHDLGEDNLAALRDAAEIRDHHLSQLTSADARGEVEAAATQLQDGLAGPRPWREAATLAAAARTVQAHYAVVRAGILAAQGAEVEAARDRVRTRAGFERLSAVEAQRVLRPITESLPDTTAHATAPSLVELRDRLAKRLAEAEERAHELLDDALSDEHKGQRTVVRVEARVRGRVIDSREQLEALFDELRERIGPHLDAKAQVRLA